MSSSYGQTSNAGNMQSTTGGFGEGATGVPNQVYDLVSVLYHCLESGSKYQQYVRDAQQSGNNDLAQFFQQLMQEDRQRAQRAQQLLGQISSSQTSTH